MAQLIQTLLPETSYKFDTVICVALQANGNSSYRDAISVRRLATEKWHSRCVVITDSSAAVPSAIQVVTKLQLLNAVQIARSEKNAKHVLFVLSAHGYQDKNITHTELELDHKTEYVLLGSQPVYDFELYQALFLDVDPSINYVCLIDTCHSGTMLDLQYISTDGYTATRSLNPVSPRNWSVCISAASDGEYAGEDVSYYGGWGGKLVASFLDYVSDSKSISFYPLHFYRFVLKLFVIQVQQCSHPVFSFHVPKNTPD